ncbi:MAG: glycosyltransferase [Verrucomicrobia bacterium]|nr:glycosyltransferase [Verrucomicrobiota bacterium]MDA1086490.1 glycosyltransferase [Verrucomicrobiota bacterium]
MSHVDPLLLSREHPELSAKVPVEVSQRQFMLIVCLVITAAAAWRPWETAKVFIAGATAFYVVITFYKLWLVYLSGHEHAELKISDEEIAALDDDSLPVYSIMVPLYREPEVVPHLIAGLVRMDYPADKKNVQLLLEEDDDLTRSAVEKMDLPPGFEVTLIPESFPRTKPKACNIGLEYATGEYLVIYDAEDRPEPDQLKKAVIGFRRVVPQVICLQSRLNFYNPRQNLLTRWFTSEYSSAFDLQLPGLASLDSVIPLGGTSNHFITSRLRELLGWDAYNVTEDCDLGVRIYRRGYKSRMLQTTTWEEACSRIRFWIPQRTRWIKGYIQTYLVHMRDPRRLYHELGLANFLHFQILIGGMVIAVLINPVFWSLAMLWFMARSDALASLFPGPVFAAGAVCLFAGNFVFTYVGAVGSYNRKYYDIVKYSLLAPIYWIFMSYSAWRALLQFFSDPFRWEKTQHGLD